MWHAVLKWAAKQQPIHEAETVISGVYLPPKNEAFCLKSKMCVLTDVIEKSIITERRLLFIEVNERLGAAVILRSESPDLGKSHMACPGNRSS
jgi:hypothetical protein